MTEQDRTPVSDAELAAAARARVDRHEAAVEYLDEAPIAVEAGVDGELGSDTPATIEAADATAELLMRNGYQAIRGHIMGAVSALENVPPELIEASIAYTEQSIRAMRASPDPRAGDAVDAATRELEAYRVMLGCRKRLLELAERHAARARLKVTP